MIPDALDFILRPVDDEQAEYAAAQTLAPADAGEVEAGAGLDERGAESARALGHEAGNETSGQPSAMRADTSPTVSNVWPAYLYREPVPTYASTTTNVPVFGPVDSDTANLLDLLANEHPAIPEEERQWEHFVGVLQRVASATGLIDQNATRPLLRGEVKPQRVGAFFHRATKSGLIRAEGWNTSDDLDGKNSGKPTKVYRWLGATS